MTSYTILLRTESLTVLARPVVGRGGFQSLIRRLQQGRRGRVLTVSERDLKALIAACRGQRPGGFQLRCRAIIVDWVTNEALRRQRPGLTVHSGPHRRSAGGDSP